MQVKAEAGYRFDMLEVLGFLFNIAESTWGKTAVWTMLDILTNGLPDHFEKTRWHHILGWTGRLNRGDNLAKGRKRHWLRPVQDCSASVSKRKVTQLGGDVASNIIDLFSKTSEDFFTDLWRDFRIGGLAHI